MAQEIERKFLVSGDFKSFAFAQSRIMQGYICSARGGTEDEAFVKPGFIGEEVTGDVRYYNSHLMKKPYKTW